MQAGGFGPGGREAGQPAFPVELGFRVREPTERPLELVLEVQLRL